MIKLGEALSGLKDMAIQRGSVFRMEFFSADGITPKNEGDTSRIKYFIVLGTDEESISVAFLLINTDVNTNLAKIISPYQYCIYPKDYAFLGNKLRHVNCFNIKKVSFERLRTEATYIGIINEDDMATIIGLVRKSPVVNTALLKKYGIE